MLAATTQSRRLFTAHPPVARRLQRQAMKLYAQRVETDLLDLEDKFSRARELLARIILQAVRNDQDNLFVTSVIDLARSVIRSPSASAIFSFETIVGLESLANMTEQLWARARLKQLPKITLEEVQLFIGVADIMRDLYLAEDYDPVDVVNVESYSAAQLIASNIHVYNVHVV